MHVAVRFLAATALILSLLAISPTPVSAQAYTFVEGFESYDPASFPCLPTPTYSTPCTTEGGLTYTHVAGNQVVSNVQDTGANSLSTQPGTRFQSSLGYCSAPVSWAVSGFTGGEIFYVTGVPAGTEGAGTSSTRIEIEFPSAVPAGTGSFRVNHARYQNGASPAATVTGNTVVFTTSFSATAWYHFTLQGCSDAVAGTVVVTSAEAIALGNGASTATHAANAGTNYQATQYLQTGGGAYHLDNIETVALSPALELDSNQVAVTNLVGYSMDNTGQNIIVRYNSGADVATYGTEDLTQIATAVTGCNRADGVVSSSFNGNIFTTYASCTVASTVDALRIRDYALATPTFPNSCEGEPTANVANNADIDVPDNMAQIGAIGDLSYDFQECVNPDGLAIGAFASWSFSSSTDGWLAAFGVAYGETGLSSDKEYSNEEHAPAIDTSTAPLQVDDFCSWTAPDGRDYIGGVSQDGVAAVYRVDRDVNVDPAFGPDSIDFTFVQKFRNAGVYAGSSGIACAGDVVAIQTPTEVRVLGNITTSPVLLHTISNTHSATRGLALTGSAEYLVYKTPTNLKVLDIETGNVTGSHDTPSGTWKGMESDHAGQNVAVFTSSLITVIDASPATCELQGNCEELGGVDDGEPGPNPDDDPAGDDDEAGSGFNGVSDAALMGFLGIVLVASFAASMNERTGAGGIGLVVFTILGLFIAYFLNYIDGWVIVVFSVLGAAVVFLGIKSLANGDGF